MTEKDDKNQGLVPNLRFPEFRDSAPWQHQKLSYLLCEPKRRNRNLKYGPEHVLSVSGEHGCVNQIEFMGRSYAGVSVKDYHVVETGDIVYTKSPLKVAPYGIIKANKGANGIVSTLYAVYRPTENGQADYIDHYFSRSYNLNSYLQPIVKKGAKNDMKVNNSDVLTGDVWVPSVGEQQKIAEFLSSLDVLIAAETDKLEALRDHKKGLLHRLFPAEGETIPRFRFPEFRHEPEWEAMTIGDVSSVTTGKRDTQNKVEGGKYPFFVRSQTVERINSYSFDEEAILTSGDGVGVGKNFHYITGKFDFHQRVYCIHNFRNIAFGKFVFQYFSVNFFDHVSKLSAKNSVDSVRMSMITDMPLHLPTLPEQEKIADCLSSIDKLIAALSDRIGSLKNHKAGLMQQLFPPSAEAAA